MNRAGADGGFCEEKRRRSDSGTGLRVIPVGDHAPEDERQTAAMQAGIWPAPTGTAAYSYIPAPTTMSSPSTVAFLT